MTRKPALAAGGRKETRSLPLTAYQESTVRFLVAPDCPDYAKQHQIVSFATLIKPSVSERRLNKALRQLVERHDVLRTSFVRKGNGWRVIIREADDAKVTVRDLTHVAEADIEAAVTEIADQPYDIDHTPLYDVHLLRFGAGGDAILMRVHHSITDGYGVLVLSEDLLNLTLGFGVSHDALQYHEFLELLAKRLPRHAGAPDKYWKIVARDAPKPANFGDTTLLEQVSPERIYVGPGGNYVERLSGSEYKAFAAAASHHGATPYTALTAILGEVIADMYGADDIVVQCVMQRSDPELSNYVGVHLHHVTLRTRIDDGASILKRAKVLSQQVYNASQNLSQETVKKFGQLDLDLHEKGASRRQFCMHFGTSDGKARSSSFSKAFRLEPGRVLSVGPLKSRQLRLNTRKYALTSLMPALHNYDGVSEIQFRHDRDQFELAEIKEVAKNFMGKLKGLCA